MFHAACFSRIQSYSWFIQIPMIVIHPEKTQTASFVGDVPFQDTRN